MASTTAGGVPTVRPRAASVSRRALVIALVATVVNASGVTRIVQARRATTGGRR